MLFRSICPSRVVRTDPPTFHAQTLVVHSRSVAKAKENLAIWESIESGKYKLNKGEEEKDDEGSSDEDGAASEGSSDDDDMQSEDSDDEMMKKEKRRRKRFYFSKNGPDHYLYKTARALRAKRAQIYKKTFTDKKLQNPMPLSKRQAEKLADIKGYWAVFNPATVHSDQWNLKRKQIKELQEQVKEAMKQEQSESTSPRSPHSRQGALEDGNILEAAAAARLLPRGATMQTVTTSREAPWPL